MKNSKRILASLMAASMIASCTALSAFTVNAASDTQCTISIDSVSDIEAYQVFSADVTGTGEDAKLTNITWGNGVNGDALLAALKNSADTEIKTAFSEAASAADVAAKLEEKFTTDSDAMFKISKIIAANITETKTTISGENNKVTGTGYYLFKDTSTSSPSAYILTEVKGDTTIMPKRDTPEIEKWIDGTNGVGKGTVENDTKANNASKGDVIDYKLISAVPDMRGYEKYYFVIEDTMEPGLTFKNDVIVKIGGNAVDISKYDLKVSDYDEVNGTNFRIVFTDFIQWSNEKDAEIEVQYSAVLNKDATIGEDSNDNTANLIYSNNPNISNDYLPGGDDPKDPRDPQNPEEPFNPDPDDPKYPDYPITPDPDHPGEYEDKLTGKTPDQKVSTYTAKLLIKKVDASGNELTGAEFLVEGDGIKSLAVVTGMEYVVADDGDYYLKDGKYYAAPAPADYTGEMYKYQAVNKVTETETGSGVYKLQAYVDANGTLAIDGLSAGTYTVKEVTAPDGYTKSNDIYTAVLAWDGDAATKWSGTLNGENANVANGVLSFSIENTKNAVLPGTGGIGTVVFYIVGSLLMAGAAVLFVVKRKKDSNAG